MCIFGSKLSKVCLSHPRLLSQFHNSLHWSTHSTLQTNVEFIINRNHSIQYSCWCKTLRTVAQTKPCQVLHHAAIGYFVAFTIHLFVWETTPQFSSSVFHSSRNHMVILLFCLSKEMGSRAKRLCVGERRLPYSGADWCSGGESDEDDPGFFSM